MNSLDQLQRFIFREHNVRGELVQLQQSYQAVLDAKAYPPVIQVLLGELMAATSLLTATLKFAGDVGMQIQSDGLVKYAVVNANNQQQLRGIARYDEATTDWPEDLQSLVTNGYLVITLTPEEGERYQGIVALDKPTLAECLQDYFLRSEHLQTQIQLFTQLDPQGCNYAGGTLLQVLPTDAGTSLEKEQVAFQHLAQLNQTLAPAEFFSTEAETLLYRLFHEEEVELFAPAAVSFLCSCSRDTCLSALANIDEQELLAIIQEEGQISMDCQFCNHSYYFDEMDVRTLKSGFSPENGSQTN